MKGTKNRRARNFELALALDQISTKQLESLRMASRDSYTIIDDDSATLQPILPVVPLNPASSSNSLLSAPRRPAVPLSLLESLPAEIHVEIVERIAEIADFTDRNAMLLALALASPVFSHLAQRVIYRHVTLADYEQMQQYLESPATIRREFATKSLALEVFIEDDGEIEMVK